MGFAACKVLQDELNRKILDNLLDFTKKYGCHRGNWASQMRASEIPTAALVLGMMEMVVLASDLITVGAVVSHLLPALLSFHVTCRCQRPRS